MFFIHTVFVENSVCVLGIDSLDQTLLDAETSMLKTTRDPRILPRVTPLWRGCLVFYKHILLHL